MKYLIVATLCSIVLYTANALDCLQCVGVGYNSCGGIKGKHENMRAIPCDADAKYCYTTREDYKDGVVTFSAYERGCVAAELDNGCEYDKEKKVTTCWETCTKDGCNRTDGVGSLRAVVPTISLLVFLTFMLRL